jgi:hypothetical protein
LRRRLDLENRFTHEISIVLLAGEHVDRAVLAGKDDIADRSLAGVVVS